MRSDDDRMERGDRLQHELYRFVVTDIVDFDFENSQPEIQELMTFRKEIVELMASENWRLIETVKLSAADRAGFDYIFINLKDDRYFKIDITLDSKCKEGLPFLCIESVFLIDVNEDDRLDLDSKQRFLHHLLDLMTSPSVFSVKETPPPNYSCTLPFLADAQQLENFRKQLDARVANLTRAVVLEDGAAVLCREATQLHEYSVHLARAIAFLKAEHVRHSDQEYHDKVDYFAGCVRAALFECVREYLGLGHGSSRKGETQSTHTLTYKRKLDILSLKVEGCEVDFTLYRVSSLVGEVVRKVCERSKGTSSQFWVGKHELEHLPARMKVIASVIPLIHSTKIHALLGTPEKVQKTKTQLRKDAKKAKAKAAAEAQRTAAAA